MPTTRFTPAIVATGLLIGALLLTADSANAQFGFSSEMLMDRLDQNDDGRLDQDEMSQSRMPIADMAKQAGIDASKGLSSDDVTKIFAKMQEQGGGGFGGGRGGRGGFGQGGFGRGGFGGGQEGNDSKAKAKAPEPPPRVTMDLQATYAAGDVNNDGQIALSEWLKWKGRAALAEFFSLDHNGDGLLTPRELAQADRAAPVDLSLIFPTAHPQALRPAAGAAAPNGIVGVPATGTSTPQPVSVVAAPSGSAATTTASAADVERFTADAQRTFKYLDRDGDGSVGDLEWERSRRWRPKFEALGADLSQPMSQEDFTRYFVQISTQGTPRRRVADRHIPRAHAALCKRRQSVCKWVDLPRRALPWFYVSGPLRLSPAVLRCLRFLLCLI